MTSMIIGITLSMLLVLLFLQPQDCWTLFVEEIIERASYLYECDILYIN